jgi:UDP-N-acetylmuramoylalanine--D-glutamate ligase
MDFLVLEMSSYQTADFKGMVDIAAVTSLYPEHLNWHGTLETYYADKLNLLTQAHIKIIHPQVRTVWPDITPDCITCKNADAVPNEYLNRKHNRANVGVVLSIIEALGLDKNAALNTMKNFTGLPHRQQELGTKNGILFVDDSIATTPQAAIAAMEAYKSRAITLIAGGYDRGIDYTPLINYICAEKINAVITMGDSGKKIYDALSINHFIAHTALSMNEALKIAQDKTPVGGVILLSPAAPSFGLFRDYIARGEAFALSAGFY